MNRKMVFNTVGMLLEVEAGLMLLPTIVALIYREDPMPFVISILLVTAVLLLCQYCRTHAYVSADPKEQDNIFLPYLFGTMKFRKAAFMNMIYPTKLGGAIFLLICFLHNSN